MSAIKKIQEDIKHLIEWLVNLLKRDKDGFNVYKEVLETANTALYQSELNSELLTKLDKELSELKTYLGVATSVSESISQDINNFINENTHLYFNEFGDSKTYLFLNMDETQLIEILSDEKLTEEEKEKIVSENGIVFSVKKGEDATLRLLKYDELVTTISGMKHIEMFDNLPIEDKKRDIDSAIAKDIEEAIDKVKVAIADRQIERDTEINKLQKDNEIEKDEDEYDYER